VISKMGITVKRFWDQCESSSQGMDNVVIFLLKRADTRSALLILAF